MCCGFHGHRNPSKLIYSTDPCQHSHSHTHPHSKTQRPPRLGLPSFFPQIVDFFSVFGVTHTKACTSTFLWLTLWPGLKFVTVNANLRNTQNLQYTGIKDWHVLLVLTSQSDGCLSNPKATANPIRI